MRDEAPIPDPLVLQLKHFVVTSLGLRDLKVDEITDDEPLMGGRIGLDPLDAVELAMFLEDKFGVVILSQNDFHAAFANIASLASYIRNHTPVSAVSRESLPQIELPVRW